MPAAKLRRLGLLTTLLIPSLSGCALEHAGDLDAESPALLESASTTALATSPILVAGTIKLPTGPTVTVSGTVYAVMAAPVGGTVAPETLYYLVDAAGTSHPLRLSAGQAGQLGVATGGVARGVTATGTLSGGVVHASSVSAGAANLRVARLVTGTKRFATLMCRFPDQPFPAAEDGLYFESLFGAEAPGLKHYFAQASGGALDFDADPFSFVSADFPGNLADYLLPSGELGDLPALVRTCAEIANTQVYLPDYDGVNIVFSHNLGDQGQQFFYAGDIDLNNDNTFKRYHFTILTPTAFRSHVTTAQAVGLALGLLRTGSTPSKLDSDWDLMSHGGRCAAPHPVFGCIGVLPSAAMRARAGWIPSAALFDAGNGYSEVILDRADVAAGPGRRTVARVAIPGASKTYTIEYRAASSATSYDKELPGAGVIVHAVDDNPATAVAGVLVDRNGDGDPNNAGSAYPVNGELFDQASKIAILPIRAEGAAMRVGISSQTVTLTVVKPSNGRITGPGINCGFSANDCTENIAVGSTVQLRALGAEDYRLDSMSGCVKLAQGCNLTMKRPATVSATFVYNPPELEPPICKKKPYLPNCHTP